MSANYDGRLFEAKQRAIRAVCRLNDPKDHNAVPDMATALDDLNKAWDQLTDCLVRQREERDRKILALIDELAESRKEQQ